MVSSKRLAALLVEQLLDRPGDIALGPADEAFVRESLEHAVGDLAGALDRGQLLFVLDGAQPFHEAAARDGLDRPVAKHFVPGVWDEVGLEADRAREASRKIFQQRAFRLFELDSLDRARSLRVAKVGEEPQAIRLDQECRVRALEAEEVEDVRRIGDEQRFLERLP
jgi:hypothetical protein